MSINVDVGTDGGGVRVPLARRRVAEVARRTLRAEKIRHALVSITFVSERRISGLNRRYLGHRGATDVITFGLTQSVNGDPVIGDVYIAPEVAARNARARGVPVREEAVRLVIHGVLHAVGYEHPEGTGREACAMWRRQERLVRRLAPRTASVP